MLCIDIHRAKRLQRAERKRTGISDAVTNANGNIQRRHVAHHIGKRVHIGDRLELFFGIDLHCHRIDQAIKTFKSRFFADILRLCAFSRVITEKRQARRGADLCRTIALQKVEITECFFHHSAISIGDFIMRRIFRSQTAKAFDLITHTGAELPDRAGAIFGITVRRKRIFFIKKDIVGKERRIELSERKLSVCRIDQRNDRLQFTFPPNRALHRDFLINRKGIFPIRGFRPEFRHVSNFQALHANGKRDIPRLIRIRNTADTFFPVCRLTEPKFRDLNGVADLIYLIEDMFFALFRVQNSSDAHILSCEVIGKHSHRSRGAHAVTDRDIFTFIERCRRRVGKNGFGRRIFNQDFRISEIAHTDCDLPYRRAAKMKPSFVHRVFRRQIVFMHDVTHHTFTERGFFRILIASCRKFKIGGFRFDLTFDVQIAIGNGSGDPRQMHRRKKFSCLLSGFMCSVVIIAHFLPIFRNSAFSSLGFLQKRCKTPFSLTFIHKRSLLTHILTPFLCTFSFRRKKKVPKRKHTRTFLAVKKSTKRTASAARLTAIVLNFPCSPYPP